MINIFYTNGKSKQLYTGIYISNNIKGTTISTMHISDKVFGKDSRKTLIIIYLFWSINNDQSKHTQNETNEGLITERETN